MASDCCSTVNRKHMKQIACLLGMVLLFGACKNEVIAKPEKLIDEDKMVNIIYDLALLEAMRSQHQGQEAPINPREYIFKKYQIDSIQFAQSNHYYASDIGNYKKMYDKVSKRIEAEQKQADALAGQNKSTTPTPAGPANPDTPQIK